MNGSRFRGLLALGVIATATSACGAGAGMGDDGDANGADAGADTSASTAVDAPEDAGVDAGTSTTPEDSGTVRDAASAIVDGGVDAHADTDSGHESDAGAPDAATDAAVESLGDMIATIARANVGMLACSTNSAGGTAYYTSCTGNSGSPEYWCADFAQWVWAQAGVNVSGLDAAAGSFYLYGQANSTLHDTPAVGDVAVFNYTSHGVAEHVAIVVQVNDDGTMETVSGDWDGDGSTEAAFSGTSRVVLNTPAYGDTQGTEPAAMGMTISGYISPHLGTDCYSDTLAREMPDNTCVQSASDMNWYQCDNGSWTDRFTDPDPCDGVYPL